MSDIQIKMKDGTVKKFPRVGRAGGSYSNHVAFEGVFAVVTDEYGKRTAIPATDIAEVIDTPDQGRW